MNSIDEAESDEVEIAVGSYWQLAEGRGVAVVIESGDDVSANFPNSQAGWCGRKEEFIRDFVPYHGDRTWLDEAIKRDWHYYFTYLGKSQRLGVC